MSFTQMEPVPTLIRRLRAELGYAFLPGRPIRISRSPGRLDVMGGIADYTGAMVCEMPLECAAAVAVQARDDRQIQVFSFNLFDEQHPFTLAISLDDLANASIDDLRRNFNEPGRKWAGYLIGCLAMLQIAGLVELHDKHVTGLNIALYSTVPLGAGVSSSAAIEVAMMMNLVDHFDLRARVDPLRVAELCQRVENQIVGAPCGIMDQVASCAGHAGSLLRMICQPHQMLEPVKFPEGVRAIGINSNVRHSVGDGTYGRTRCAAFMGHAIILNRIRKMGETMGRELIADPMGGYLANLDQEDYKRLFRPQVPEIILGQTFLDQYGPTIDKATRVDPRTEYHVQLATDHHVMEARRVRDFVKFLSESSTETDVQKRKLALDKAGHLMYASHKSYTDNALLGAEECDLLVDMVRRNESAGLYGAKITGGGSGGTVAILCETHEKADAMVRKIMADYHSQVGREPQLFEGTSPGGWNVGTHLI